MAADSAATPTGIGPHIGRAIPHEASIAHVTGRTVYLDDIAPQRNELLIELFGSPLAHARIVSIDVSEAARTAGIVAVFTAGDVAGDNQFGAAIHDEELLASSECGFIGQPIVALAGENRAALRLASQAVRLELEALPAVLSIDQAIALGQFLGPTRRIVRGEVEPALASAAHSLEGTLRTGGQEHFYLETQGALAVPGEHGSICVYSSTQHPSEVQAMVAHCLGLRQNQVVCVATRMGGGFGGKESQAAHPAVVASLVASRTGRPARLVYSRSLDMRITGKRHPYLTRYRVGFTDLGRIEALSIELYSDGGSACDLSLAVMDRSMLHADNAYYIPHFAVSGTVCRTNLPPNTAMRLRRPQGVAAIENVIEDVAAFLGIDPLVVRLRNCYQGEGRDVTPYGQVVSRNTLPRVIERLAETSEYARRRDEALRFSAGSLSHVRGLSLVPVKFGISFTRQMLNQASALVNIYTDGSIQVSTGGTEMGQGLFTKIAQLVADQFALPLEFVRVMPTSTEKNNNTSATAASASTDLNGTAALRACEILKQRLALAAAGHLAGLDHGPAANTSEIAFERGTVYDRRRPDRRLDFAKLALLAHQDRVDLGARGFYATPGIGFDREAGQGTPFLYFTTGAAVSEVLIDRLTGELSVTRVDILLDLGRSLNPAIDRGQVIGGFVQGMGWATTEELRYSEAGELLSDSPNNYKIPSIDCIPADFRVEFLEDSDNPVNLFSSKAVGEPPFVLGLSVWAAAKQALSSLRPARRIELALPATSEAILWHLCDGDRDKVPDRGRLDTSLEQPSVEANIRETAEF